jgi:flagellar hook-basal body complex protein FliE
MANSRAMALVKSHAKHLDGSGSFNWPIPTGTVPAGSLGRPSDTYSAALGSVNGSALGSINAVNGIMAGEAASPTAGFGTLLAQALEQTNDMQLETTRLSQQMITDPDAVNIHDITIAMAEANLSLSMTKAVFDQAIKAYREIISTR